MDARRNEKTNELKKIRKTNKGKNEQKQRDEGMNKQKKERKKE